MLFSMNGTTRGRPNVSIVDLYESIIAQGGVHIPLTKQSFKVLYKRYKQLKGTIDFSDLEEGLSQDVE